MLDEILQEVLEIVVEGAIDGSMSRRVPLPLRILLGVFIFVIYGGLCGLFVYLGIREDEPVVILIGVLLFILFGGVFAWKYIKMKRSS